MATGAAGDGFFRGIYEGCISGGDMSIQRRPYHKNCGCALHKSRGHCRHLSRHNNISYPIRRSWSDSSLALMSAASGHTSPCSSSSPTTAPGEIPRVQSHLTLCREEDEEGEPSLFNISSKV